MKTLPDGFHHSALALFPLIEHLVIGQPDHPVATQMKVCIALTISIETSTAGLMVLERVKLHNERVADQEVNASNSGDIHLLPEPDAEAVHAESKCGLRS